MTEIIPDIIMCIRACIFWMLMGLNLIAFVFNCGGKYKQVKKMYKMMATCQQRLWFKENIITGYITFFGSLGMETLLNHT